MSQVLLSFPNRLRLLALVCLPLSCSHFCRADERLEPLKPVRLVAKPPFEVKKAMPHGAKTLEMALFRIGNRSSDVLVHLYADAPTLISAEDWEPEVRDRLPKVPLVTSGHLDLWVQRNKRFVRVQSLKFARPERDQDYLYPPAPPIGTPLASFSLGDVQWLRPRERKQPIVTVRIPNYRGDDGGIERVFVFRDGINKPTLTQDSDYWTYDGDYQDIGFYSVDKAGNTLLAEVYDRTSGGPDFVTHNETPDHWDGKNWRRADGTKLGAKPSTVPVLPSNAGP